ncbi:alpha/beta hydrolase [Fibrella forsythiae]|uniref:Alpha/beta hydrolase n=1 Tax=Fibrella forsythiae TaxID=2817061 RepID=A0ABS3JCI2_9BACT|nr:alpha/beta hydrolase-fold protein [Fibrella forsythiae]MBO0947719.1 alpha/beta hydrolase [Fibrella forsythiae]
MRFRAVLAILCLLGPTGCTFSQSTRQKVPLPAPFVLGIVDSVWSATLHETRILNIYLPAGYSPDSAKRYPVIYLLDGGADEDFVHIVGLVKYNTTPWIDRFPESIVVGIANVNRRRDFTFGVANLDFVARAGFKPGQFSAYGGSASFMAFIEKELQPFIAGRYATTAAKTIIGESLGGLLATEILLKKPTLFDTYIILSPSLWWGQEALLTQAPALLKMHAQKRSVYIGAGARSESEIMYADAKALADALTTYGAQTTTVIFDYLPDETHATMIHQGVYNAFKLLYPIKK